jgi:hypothetical protein
MDNMPSSQGPQGRGDPKEVAMPFLNWIASPASPPRNDDANYFFGFVET